MSKDRNNIFLVKRGDEGIEIVGLTEIDDLWFSEGQSEDVAPSVGRISVDCTVAPPRYSGHARLCFDLTRGQTVE